MRPSRSVVCCCSAAIRPLKALATIGDSPRIAARSDSPTEGNRGIGWTPALHEPALHGFLFVVVVAVGIRGGDLRGCGLVGDFMSLSDNLSRSSRLTLMVLSAAALALSHSLAATGGPGTVPECVPTGGSSPVSLETPGPGTPGFPTGGVIVGQPAIYEEDYTSPDDLMGNASINPTTGQTEFQIHNSGGNLSGPNTIPQNGGPEGSEIEVYVEYEVRYPCNAGSIFGWEITGGAGPVSGGVHSSSTPSHTTWCTTKVQSRVVPIRPC